MSEGGRSAGKWVVLTLLAMGVILAIVGVRYSLWLVPATPRPAIDATSRP